MKHVVIAILSMTLIYGCTKQEEAKPPPDKLAHYEDVAKVLANIPFTVHCCMAQYQLDSFSIDGTMTRISQESTCEKGAFYYWTSGWRPVQELILEDRDCGIPALRSANKVFREVHFFSYAMERQGWFIEGYNHTLTIVTKSKAEPQVQKFSNLYALATLNDPRRIMDETGKTSRQVSEQYLEKSKDIVLYTH